MLTHKKWALYGICILTLGLMAQPAQAQTYASPVEYMNDVFGKFGTYRDDLWDYMRTAARGRSARKVEKRRSELLRSTAIVRRDLSRMAAYEGDVALRDAAVTYMDLTYKVLNEDYDKIVDLEAIAEESYDMMEAYLKAKEMANTRLDEASEMLEAAQEEFAEANNINLIEGEVSKRDQKISRAAEVFSYYNRVYLVFFKSFKQEAYWLEAVNNADVNAMVQNQNNLKKYALEGLSMLDTMEVYADDPSLIMATQEMLQFYVDEAEAAQVMANFYLEKDNFERIKQALDAKPAKKRTQEDIDQYNAAVNTYNEATNAFNQTNEELNKQRNKFLNEWNKAGEKYISKHAR